MPTLRKQEPSSLETLTRSLLPRRDMRERNYSASSALEYIEQETHWIRDKPGCCTSNHENQYPMPFDAWKHQNVLSTTLDSLWQISQRKISSFSV